MSSADENEMFVNVDQDMHAIQFVDYLRLSRRTAEGNTRSHIRFAAAG